ncbi:putative Calcium-activated chloride channel-domain-containing protein [Seiridium cardinale]|uniref:Calcium-activated chloride channel-domain-containing protein n=1 Tax=Seiridium cardinale TaxID=138064 RepID=A0ABR2XRG2_9PEZI
MEGQFNFSVSRADTFPQHIPRTGDHIGLTYNDKYVMHYDFTDLDNEAAAEELACLCSDIEHAGLQSEVRAGEGKSLLIFVRASKELLSSEIHKSRVKDWLYGITKTQPQVDKKSKSQSVNNAFESESILCVYRLLNWSKENGGAGITPGFGKWENVKSIFPIHNEVANRKLLKHLSKRLFLTKDDLDQIRDLFGSQASLHAATGVLAWAFLPKYSLVYAILTLLGCTIFLEYWKILQADLSIRWSVRGVAALKTNRPNFHYDKVIIDESGRRKHYYPKWKSFARQSLQIPFFAFCLLALGIIITLVFALEVLVSEVYHGPYQGYLEYAPTLILAAGLPYMNSFLEDVATRLAEFENHRTKDNFGMSLTQKLFVLSFIVNYLPILLTAFVYIPLGNRIVPWLGTNLPGTLGNSLDDHFFDRDPDRLRNEVIALTLTGQLSDMFEEMVVPYVMHRLKSWWHAYRASRSHFSNTKIDDPSEKAFLLIVRRQASLPPYNVQDDISEMVIQFGYLALFSPVWPLVSVGFLINNWIELRSDFLKICIEHQRPHPVRTDGIGPWIHSLDALTWMGSVCTAAVVHMFGTETGSGNTVLSKAMGGVGWWSLPITIFVSEHIFLVLRALVRTVLQRVGSEEVRKERNERYARRSKYMDELEAANRATEMLDVGAVQRRKSVRMADADIFWTKQVEKGSSTEAGIELIKALGQSKKTRVSKFWSSIPELELLLGSLLHLSNKPIQTPRWILDRLRVSVMLAQSPRAHDTAGHRRQRAVVARLADRSPLQVVAMAGTAAAAEVGVAAGVAIAKVVAGIVVEKLTKNINEDHLREIFGQYGSIRDLDLPMNRQFNTNRGTAYILYVHEADAEAAIAHMHEAQLDGAVINVSIVLPRRKFSQSPPTASRGANIDPRVPAPGPRGGFAGGPRGPRGGGFGGPSFGGGPGGGRPRSPTRFGGGRQGRGRDREANNYRPGTRSPSHSRSRSPPPRRGRSPSYDSRSRSPAPRRRGGGRRDSFDDRDTRRRSPSYDDYRSRSRSRGRDFR